MAKSIVIFDASEYHRSHMKMPRGHGYWAFGYSAKPTIEQTIWVHGKTYTEAKEAAKAQAVKTFPDKKCITLYTQP